MANEDVKIMAEIGLKLWENKQSVSECVESLQELERLFRTSFSKNVGDFYTIGMYIVCYIVTLLYCYTTTLLYLYTVTLPLYVGVLHFSSGLTSLFISSIYSLIFLCMYNQFTL